MHRKRYGWRHKKGVSFGAKEIEGEGIANVSCCVLDCGGVCTPYARVLLFTVMAFEGSCMVP